MNEHCRDACRTLADPDGSAGKPIDSFNAGKGRRSLPLSEALPLRPLLRS